MLQQPQSRGRSPEAVLHDWLSGILLEPAAPYDHVANVIHTEIQIVEDDVEGMDALDIEPMDFQPVTSPPIEQGLFVFMPKSTSGERLLNSLVQFCKSYEHWQFSRWLHHVNASDFCGISEHE